MTEHIKVRIARIHPQQKDLALPLYATEGSAGMDLCASVEDDLELLPGDTMLVPTGISIELPEGIEAQVRPRSGLAAKHSIGILNAPGTIDSDYRGEVKVILTNFGKERFTIHRGDRVAQLVIHRYIRAQWDEVATLTQTSRGAGGFGHTGLSSTTHHHDGNETTKSR